MRGDQHLLAALAPSEASRRNDLWWAAQRRRPCPRGGALHDHPAQGLYHGFDGVRIVCLVGEVLETAAASGVRLIFQPDAADCLCPRCRHPAR